MGSYVPPTSLLSSIFLPNPLEDVKKGVHGNTDCNSRNLQVPTIVDTWKKLKTRMISFLFCCPPCLSPLHLDFFKLRPPRVEEDIMDFALLIRSFFFILSTDLILTTQLDGESQQKGERRPQHPSTNSGSTSNGSNQGQYPTTCYRASLIS